MSDIAKWALLVAGLVAIVAAILLLPVFDIINLTELTNGISYITQTAGGYLQSARGIINYFLTPIGRTILTAVLGWVIGERFVTWGIVLLSKAYTWIFK